MKYALILIIIITGIIGFIIFSNINENIKEKNHNDEEREEYEIFPGDVAKKIENKDDIILLDVRTSEEYAKIHLENALLLPAQELSAQMLENIGLGEDAKEKEIIIYCKSGARSKMAYDIMKSLGYMNIKSIAGGMIHWQEDNYPFTEVGEHNGQKIETKITNKIIGPKILFNKTTHNFGVIPQFGGKVETKFIVKNIGVKILEIGEITTSCNCTTASISSASIQIGDEAEITVVFDPNFHDEPTGVFRRTVFIPTNDSDKPEAEITIEVDIDEDR